MLALAALEDWYITGLDVRSAYLYGKLDEDIYMEQPEGFAAPGCQDWFSRSEMDVDGGAKLMGEHVVCGE